MGKIINDQQKMCIDFITKYEKIEKSLGIEIDRIHPIYIQFLDLCRTENISVYADIHLIHTEETAGFCGKEDIYVHRKKHACSISKISNDEELEKFVLKSKNRFCELSILLHEYGHLYHKHPLSVNDLTSNQIYEQEAEAWDRGEIIGRKIGMKDFVIFYQVRDDLLQTYQDGLFE